MTISPVTRLWLVRHGQTDWNAQRRIQGHTPTELNAMGRAQAKLLADWLFDTRQQNPFAALYSSDLPRAAQTAEIIGDKLGLTVSCTPELRERHLGEFEGKTWEQVRSIRAANGNRLIENGDLADWTGVPGVETDQQLWQRVSKILDAIAQRHPGGDILAVSHGGVMKHVIWHILGLPEGAPRRFPLTNGLICIVEPRRDGWYLSGLFDAGMLSGKTPEDTAIAPSV